MPQTPLICFPNVLDDADLSGGAWTALAQMPRSKVLTRSPSDRARTVNASDGQCRVVAEMPNARSVRVVGCFGHNFSRAAQYRIQVRLDIVLLYDSGWRDVYQPIYPAGATLFGEDVGGGSVTEDQWMSGKRLPIIEVLDDHVTAGTVILEVNDATNPYGYLEIGRMWASPALEFANGRMLDGARYDETDESELTATAGGAYHIQGRAHRRTWAFDLGVLTGVEAKIQVAEMKRRIGRTGQILFLCDDGPPLLRFYEQSFLAVLSETSPAAVVSAMIYKQPLVLAEDL